MNRSLAVTGNPSMNTCPIPMLDRRSFLISAVGFPLCLTSGDPRFEAPLSDAAIARRKLRIVRAIAADPSFNPKRKNPKFGHGIAGARLALHPNDADALEYLLRVASIEEQFAYHGLAANFARFGQNWSPALVEAVRASVTGWDGFLGGGTENMVAMRRSAGLIFGERFEREIFRYGLTGRELADECKSFLRRYGRAVFGGSMVEYLSPIYIPTNSAPWAVVAEFSRDDEARLMAEALLDWMYADVAVNSFECSTVAPIQREKGLLTGSYQKSVPTTNTQWVFWIFFGAGNLPDGDGPFPPDVDPCKGPIAQHALSSWSPHPIIRNIAAHRTAMPYGVRQSRSSWAYLEPTMVNRFGKTEAQSQPVPPKVGTREHLRSVWIDPDYAIGAGYFQTAPSDPLVRTLVPFGVWWRSANENNFLLVAHPFWFAEKPGEEGEPPVGDNDWLGASPFCRMVHHENAAVLLYDLPEKDPYLGLPQGGSEKLRVKRSGHIIPFVYVYVPETVDERTETAAGFFARQGDVYLAIRPLTAGATWTSSTHPGFVRLAIPGRLTGVIIEVGSRREYGSFAQFQAKIATTKLDTSLLASTKAVDYSSSRGHQLHVAHLPGTWLPDAAVNGQKLYFAKWPISESPSVRSENHVLDVNDGQSGFTIDWRGAHPVYTYYELRNGSRVETKRRFLRNGKLLTETL